MQVNVPRWRGDRGHDASGQDAPVEPHHPGHPRHRGTGDQGLGRAAGRGPVGTRHPSPHGPGRHQPPPGHPLGRPHRRTGAPDSSRHSPHCELPAWPRLSEPHATAAPRRSGRYGNRRRQDMGLRPSAHHPPPGGGKRGRPQAGPILRSRGRPERDSIPPCWAGPPGSLHQWSASRIVGTKWPWHRQWRPTVSGESG